MRTILAILLTALLLATPLALAGGRSAEHRADGEHRARGGDDGAREARAELAHNRSALMESFLERLHAARASWLENATKVREACAAQREDMENLSKENRTKAAHCVRDGYADWRADHKSELRALREELRALFAAARRHAAD